MHESEKSKWSRSVVDCSLQGSSIHGIFQARVLEWGAIAFSKHYIVCLFFTYIHLSTKVHLVKAMVFPVVMYGCELDYKESWAPKNWCFWTVVLEKTLESPLDCKEIQPVHPKGDQSWVFIGRTDVEAEIPILWPPDAKSWLIWKDPDVGNCGQEEKGTTEDEMVGWHHWLNVHGFGWTPGVGDGQGGLVCCMQSMGSQRVWHNWATELNWTEFLLLLFIILFKVHLLIYDIHLEFSFPFYSVFSFFSYFHLFHPPKPQWNL